MKGLEKAIYTVRSMSVRADATEQKGDPRRLLIVCLLYLIAMLSVPVADLQSLIFFAIYPVVASAVAGISFATVFVRSLVVLPFVLLIGIFNPIYHDQAAFRVGSVVVTVGWLEFASIMCRSLFSVQALLILVGECGFPELCRSLRRIGVPSFLTTQLLLVFRYMEVLMQEALDMKRARMARGFGRKSMPLRMWGDFVGQLFIRAVERSRRIYRAMLARGFSGDFPSLANAGRTWKLNDTLILLLWSAVFALLRFVNISHFLVNHTN